MHEPYGLAFLVCLTCKSSYDKEEDYASGNGRLGVCHRDTNQVLFILIGPSDLLSMEKEINRKYHRYR